MRLFGWFRREQVVLDLDDSNMSRMFRAVCAWAEARAHGQDLGPAPLGLEEAKQFFAEHPELDREAPPAE